MRHAWTRWQRRLACRLPAPSGRVRLDQVRLERLLAEFDPYHSQTPHLAPPAHPSAQPHNVA
jgi:hypothetical protein